MIFNVAFGLSDRNDQPDVVEDYRYGTLQAAQTFRNRNGTLEYKNLKSKTCNPDTIAE